MTDWQANAGSATKGGWFTEVSDEFQLVSVHWKKGDSDVAQSYPHVQCFLAKGSYRTFGKLCYFDHWSSRL